MNVKYMREYKVSIVKSDVLAYAKEGVSSDCVYKIFKEYMESRDRETVCLVLLNNKNMILGFHVLSTGSLSESIVDPGSIVKMLCLGNATRGILMHNHPSGFPAPSADDIKVTLKIKEVCNFIDKPLLDHIIFGDDSFYSFADEGKL